MIPIAKYGTVPCKDCPYRCGTPNCHDTCDDFKEYKAKQAAGKKKHKEDATYKDYKYDKLRREKKA